VSEREKIKKMDVYHIDSSSISSSMIDVESSMVDDITEVKFETHSDFDLNFFDTPDDSMTQAGFSNPNSVESSSSPTPEPHLPLTPTNAISHLSQQSTNVAINQQQQHQPALTIVKNGKASDSNSARTTFCCCFFLFRRRRKQKRRIHFLMLMLSRNCITMQFSFRLNSRFAMFCDHKL
jgi:hypothetical protein